MDLLIKQARLEDDAELVDIAISEGKILATSILPRHFYLNNEDFAALLSQRLQLFT